ncbi:MAG: hypothetical protein JXA04_07015 [Gammaproteobacteria bacterium]|nr:hypothetical protein [Gammaproteobacteria bacterium]
MLRPSLIVLLLASLFLTACATIPQPDTEQTALSKKSLQRAGDVAAELVTLQQKQQPSQTDYRRRAKLREQLWQFEREVIRTAIRLEQNDDWIEAEKVFKHATKAVPDSHILRSARYQFADRRAIREEVLRAELAIHQGEQLLQNAGAYDSLQRVTPLKFLTWVEVNAYERRRLSSAATLKRFADKALKRDDFYLARRCLSLSFRLHNDDEVKQKLMLADAYISRVRQRIDSKSNSSVKPARAVAATGKPDAELLVGEFYHALQKDDFHHAKRYMSELRLTYPQHRNLVSMSSQYKLRLNRCVNDAIEKGKVLYSEGKVKQALRVWRDAERLAPNNVELLSGIARAEKVLQNLKALSAQQTGGHSS